MRPRAITHRRGTTLIEGLMASVLLATSVVGISGSMLATYQNQTQLQLRRDAAGTGRTVMETVTALPLESASGASLAGYQSASGGSTNAVIAALSLKGASSSSTSSSGAIAVSTDGVLGGILPGVGVSLIVGGTDASASKPASDGSLPPSVLVERRNGLTGATSATGDFALVTVTVPTDGNKMPVRLKRLVTAVEAAGNQTK